MMDKEKFVTELAKIDIFLSGQQLGQYELYYKTLVAYNEKVNLTALTSEDDVYEKHFYDCLLLSQAYSLSNQTLCDVGSGAGFPSIVLKIAFPDLKVTIIDSLNKRITFLNELIDTLKLTDVQAIHARAEEYAHENREAFDIVTARAVARLNILNELCAPLVKVGGVFIAMKGKQGLVEAQEAENGNKVLKLESYTQKRYHLISDDSIRYFLIYQKKSETDSKYPRSFQQIKKKPL